MHRKRKRKKIIRLVAICFGVVLVLLVCLYVVLLGVLEGGVVLHDPKFVQTLPDTRDIELPWYLRVGLGELYYATYDGVDAEGNEYSQFLFEKRALFGDAEAACIVSWESGEVRLFLCGGDRMSFLIAAQYPNVTWQDEPRKRDFELSQPLGRSRHDLQIAF